MIIGGVLYILISNIDKNFSVQRLINFSVKPSFQLVGLESIRSYNVDLFVHFCGPSDNLVGVGLSETLELPVGSLRVAICSQFDKSLPRWKAQAVSGHSSYKIRANFFTFLGFRILGRLRPGSGSGQRSST